MDPSSCFSMVGDFGSVNFFSAERIKKSEAWKYLLSLISDDLENFSIWLALSILTTGIHVAGLTSKKYLIV